MERYALWLAIASALVSGGIAYGTLNSQVSEDSNNVGLLWQKIEDFDTRISHLEGNGHQ